MRRSAASRRARYNASRLLEQDELVMVFPEGVKGTGKPFSERYRLQRFGRGGFVEMALRTGSPIIPVAVVGAEEIYPKIGDSRGRSRGSSGRRSARSRPTFPWLGPLGLVPLPSRWRIEFCEPIDLSGLRARGGGGQGAALRRSPSRCARRSRQRLYENLVKRGSALSLKPGRC